MMSKIKAKFHCKICKTDIENTYESVKEHLTNSHIWVFTDEEIEEMLKKLRLKKSVKKV